VGQVTVAVNGRNFTVACDNGQEDHIAELAAYLDHHVQELSDSLGAVGDARLMMLAGIMVADELSDTVAKLEELEAEVESLRAGHETVAAQSSEFETQAVQVIDGITTRIEEISGRLAAD